MSFSVDSGPQLGTVETIVTSGRGLNPEELTRMILPKLVYIGPDVPEEMRAQAEAGRERMRILLTEAFRVAQKSQNTSIFNVLMNAGHESAAEIVRSL